jgi:hypothetical protein
VRGFRARKSSSHFLLQLSSRPKFRQNKLFYQSNDLASFFSWTWLWAPQRQEPFGVGDFLKEDKEEVTVKIDDLIQLRESGIEHAELVQRELKPPHVDSLKESDENDWPPILITKTSIGYVIADGYHRIAAMRLKKKAEIRATIKTFKGANEMEEEAFRANLTHGLRADLQSRSNYAWWLHLVYPSMEQIEIARRAGISQPTVSNAIKRMEAKVKREAAKKKPTPGAALVPQEDPQRAKIREECQKLARDALKLLEDISELPERERRAAIADSLQNVQDREVLFRVSTMLEEILKPHKPRPPRKKAPAAAP